MPHSRYIHFKFRTRFIDKREIFQGNFDESLAMFLCNGGKGYKGEFVYIRDDRENGAGVEYFSLCEVRVFGLRGMQNGIFLDFPG